MYRLKMAATSSLAKERWKMLGEALRTNHSRSSASVSVRRFEHFGLFECARVQDDGEWYRYSARHLKQMCLFIRKISNCVSKEHLAGFNNTGNICIWPSEEVLAYYLLKNRHLCSNKSICELGGGQSCLAGLVVAVSSSAKRVLLTDGNDCSMKNVEKIINRNILAFGNTSVSSRILRWGEVCKEFEAEFDIIICSDCLFFKEAVTDLLETMVYLLKKTGEVIIMAPTRGSSLQNFCELASLHFTVSKSVDYDDHIQHVYKHNKENNLSFCENLHYPVLISLKRQDSCCD